ncbi:cohesin subunit SA-2-like isoform X1 [Sphaerodactylus townsendi]|uniref:cohesin subunit SA-2-like isoform X1 n=1 Tax=Sphaerodactylus townsendi TaxID=933632 RepID=UPI0020273E57|nr:cohesin subunit SA-2-like isoform X1 [Sphaerodactylus townsendi]XP_048348679.1 cohesin subunit SA-2-like isoform X1 [Sphaerodactylus townsendi]XP_048348680.1 cohesin subunit SA-2-like isoform X1 [Sphaerodactylus townsendi]XP_048348681.1 cohesin subunit SA-2-like isoform X1 [Sphaerodactylus townsendi]
MIAEPNSAVNLPNHKENGIHEESVPESTAQNGNCLRNGSIKSFQGKRKIYEQCENRRRNSSSRRRSYQPHNGDVVEAVTLFEVVSMGKRAMQFVVDDWVEAYKKDRDVALLDLINFFIQCSGCQGMVTAEMFQSFQNCDVMQKMTETFDEETGLQYKKFMAYPWILTVTWPVDMDNEDYPLIRPGSYWKKFKANFCEFTEVLIQQCQCSILCDSYLLDTIISLLTGLADSTVRAFRHTSTLAAMKLLTALVNLNLSLDASKRNLERLYEVEKNRTAGKRTNSRLDQLEKKRKEYEQKPLEIENMMNAIFKGIFLQRYRDVIPEIRAICIEEMGSWMKIYPRTFLNDSYLKYIGWMLYDKQPEVRLKCLHGLQGIYDQKKLVSKMDLFNSRFKDRIMSMTLDKDHEVAVQAMKLLVLMSQNCEDSLSSEDCETLYQFVYTTHRPLAVAAGELLYRRLIVQEIEMEALSKSNGKLEPIASQLKTLIMFFLESELHSHVTYLVDSLWDWSMSLLKDWECMTSLLLENADNQKEALSDAQESALIEIILATVREAAEGHPPVGRGGTKKILSAKEKKIQVEDSIKITEHFTVVLPQLLAKYSEDAERVTNLLQIPQYFDLELYGTGSLEKHLDALLREVKAIVMDHCDMDVLEACSRLYCIFCSEELPTHNKVVVARTELADELVDKLNQLLDTFLKEGEGLCAEEEGINCIYTTLRRITVFHNAHDLSKWNLYDKMSELLVFEVEHSCLPAQIILPALQCAYFALLWQLDSVAKKLPSKENLFVLKTRLRHYSHVCACYFSHSNRDVREKAFMVLCDFLMIVSHQDTSDDGTLGLLEYFPSMTLQSKMLLFIQDHIFTEEKDKGKELAEEEDRKNEDQTLDILHTKRGLLAAYCKLIIYNVIGMTAASEIYKHYMKAYNDFGDIIKETLSRTRHNDKIQSAKTLILCLQQLFQKLVESQGCGSGSSTDTFSASFNNIKELARRFSLTFGWDQVKTRESVAMIHKEGIEFAFQGAAGMEGKCLPPNLNFLTILSEFSNKLLKPDKRLVYSYLLRYEPDPALSKGDSWNSLVSYKTSLLASEEEESSAASSLNEWPPVSDAKTPFKRKFSEGSLHKSNHTETTNRTSDICYSAQLPSLAPRSRKRLKSHNSSLQEYPPLLAPANLRRKNSCQVVIKVEEVPSEDADVDVVGAD